jgi:hypothetical protein
MFDKLRKRRAYYKVVKAGENVQAIHRELQAAVDADEPYDHLTEKLVQARIHHEKTRKAYFNV